VRQPLRHLQQECGALLSEAVLRPKQQQPHGRESRRECCAACYPRAQPCPRKRAEAWTHVRDHVALRHWLLALGRKTARRRSPHSCWRCGAAAAQACPCAGPAMSRTIWPTTLAYRSRRFCRVLAHLRRDGTIAIERAALRYATSWLCSRWRQSLDTDRRLFRATAGGTRNDTSAGFTGLSPRTAISPVTRQPCASRAVRRGCRRLDGTLSMGHVGPHRVGCLTCSLSMKSSPYAMPRGRRAATSIHRRRPA